MTAKISVFRILRKARDMYARLSNMPSQIVSVIQIPFKSPTYRPWCLPITMRSRRFIRLVFLWVGIYHIISLIHLCCHLLRIGRDTHYGCIVDGQHWSCYYGTFVLSQNLLSSVLMCLAHSTCRGCRLVMNSLIWFFWYTFAVICYVLERALTTVALWMVSIDVRITA